MNSEQQVGIAVMLDQDRRLSDIQKKGEEWFRKNRREHTTPPNADALSFSQRYVQRELMRRGPYLFTSAEGNTFLVVPSEWKDPRAIRFWKRTGFRWNRQASVWLRDTKRPYRGQVYDAQVWLRDVRRRFYEFWPELTTQGGAS